MNKASHVPGEAELWIFIFADLILFGLFFVVRSWNRAILPELFAAGGEQMNRALGLANTLVLISSSAAVACGLHCVRLGRGREARIGYASAAALGSVFVFLKMLEYGQHIQAGASAVGNVYFMYYFAFTGIHLLHVLIGITALLVARSRCHSFISGVRSAQDGMVFIESAGVFWHLVDLLWIVLFLLIYLAR